MRLVEAPPAPEPEPAAPVELPGLELGEGERRSDCRHYPECLSQFCSVRLVGKLRGGKPEPRAHCPTDCEAYELIPVEARVEAASPRDGRAAFAQM